MAARGIALPPRGSVQDRVIQEVLRRERAERFAMMELVALLVAPATGVPDEVVDQLLEQFAEVVSHDRYRSSIIGRRRRAEAAALRKKQEDERLLAKVDKYTVEDEDLAPTPDPAKGRGPVRRK